MTQTRVSLSIVRRKGGEGRRRRRRRGEEATPVLMIPVNFNVPWMHC
jgi:hypothetical protein